MKVIKVVKYAYISLLAFIVVCLLTFILASSFNKKRYLEVFGYSFFEVKSYSMYPELTKGDLIVVKKKDASEYELGMVVTYLRPTDSTPTTHKIISIDGDVVTTQGINTNTNKDPDLPFDINCIIGEVVMVWDGYGKVKEFVTHPIGFIIIILTSFLFIEGLNYLEEKYSKKEV